VPKRVTYPEEETIKRFARIALHADTVVDEHDLDRKGAPAGDCRNFSGDGRGRLHRMRRVRSHHSRTSVLLFHRMQLCSVDLLESV